MFFMRLIKVDSYEHTASIHSQRLSSQGPVGLNYAKKIIH